MNTKMETILLLGPSYQTLDHANNININKHDDILGAKPEMNSWFFFCFFCHTVKLRKEKCGPVT